MHRDDVPVVVIFRAQSRPSDGLVVSHNFLVEHGAVGPHVSLKFRLRRLLSKYLVYGRNL